MTHVDKINEYKISKQEINMHGDVKWCN